MNASLAFDLIYSFYFGTCNIQVVVDGVLREWKVNGLEAHIERVRSVYKERRDKMIVAAEKHLKG